MGTEASKPKDESKSGSEKKDGYDSAVGNMYGEGVDSYAEDGLTNLAPRPLATKKELWNDKEPGLNGQGSPSRSRRSPRRGKRGGLPGSPVSKSKSNDGPASTVSSHVPDEAVTVNLAMADLMAYLQVVANNSNDLPLTRRDDPEVTTTISTLTADQYARKSAAFVPADVRMIGGIFSKYGRVWDLPTSEEYDATDGAQEPGRSYGGACCNAMLKVLYDAANEAIDAAQNNAEANDLFDDDDESLLERPVGLSRNRTFESLTLGDVAVPSSITWAELLRKMKAEVAEIEYSQSPTVTSSRRFDLNQPFSLIPESFDSETGKKRSLLIGCNYHDTPSAELKASHDDVRSMKDYIVNVHGFPEDKGFMTVLMDDGIHKDPTHLNITEAFKAISEQSNPGDAVFVQFSGHGGRILDAAINNEIESYDEVFAPSDYAESGVIRDTLMFKTLIAPMRYGVTVTVIIDTCDTGMMLDLPYSWTTRKDNPDSVAKLSRNDDFSFVRFLKVVKALYETSTFTKLGKTVGTALQRHDEEETIDDEGTPGQNTLMSGTEGETMTKDTQAAANTSILSALAACTSPGSSPTHTKKADSPGQKDRGTDASTTGSRPAASEQSLLEQCISCTVGADASSDDEYSPRVDHMTSSEGATTSYGDTDEEYVAPRRRRRREV